MAGLVPDNPDKVIVFRNVTPNILTMSAPFKRFGRIKMGGRGTVVRMASGSLAVFSPTALTAEAQRRVQELGEVKYISALDFEHHMFLGAWSQAFPSAKVIGVEGLPEKRAKQGSEKLDFFKVFTKGNKDQKPWVDEEFDAEFDVEYVPGHGNKELVFNFRRDRTLIEGDLLFNLPATEQYSKSDEDPKTGIFTKIFVNTMNTQESAIWQKRFVWYGLAADRPSFNESVKRIERWDFDRLIPCHGDVIESGGKGIFQKVFEWNLAAAKST